MSNPGSPSKADQLAGVTLRSSPGTNAEPMRAQDNYIPESSGVVNRVNGSPLSDGELQDYMSSNIKNRLKGIYR